MYIFNLDPKELRSFFRSAILKKYDTLYNASVEFGKDASYFYTALNKRRPRLFLVKQIKEYADFLGYDVFILFVPKNKSERFKKIADKLVKKFNSRLEWQEKDTNISNKQEAQNSSSEQNLSMAKELIQAIYSKAKRLNEEQQQKNVNVKA